MLMENLVSVFHTQCHMLPDKDSPFPEQLCLEFGEEFGRPSVQLKYD